MGTVVQLKNQINDTFAELKDSVDDKLTLVEERIKNKLVSNLVYFTFINGIYDVLTSTTSFSMN